MQHWDKGDPGVGKFLELRVQSYAGTDLSMNPKDYEPAKPGKAMGKTMIPLWLDRNNPNDMAKLQTARHRTLRLRTLQRNGRRALDDQDRWRRRLQRRHAPHQLGAQLATGPTDAGYTGDGTMEIWNLSTGGGWSHPVHVHFEEGIILSRGGKPPPEWENWARKDVYRIGSEPDSLQSVQFAIHFREFAGTYMEHCHNTQHEDNAMLLRWDIEHPGQFQVMPTPLPTWDGVQYVNSTGLANFRTGIGTGTTIK